MKVQNIQKGFTIESLRALGKSMAEGYAAETITATEVAQNGRFSYIMPQLQAALESGKLRAAKRVTKETLDATYVIPKDINNRAWQFFSDIILPMAEKNPKLAQYVLWSTKKGAGKHNINSLLLRIEALQRLGHTSKHMQEAKDYTWELVTYEDQKRAGNGFKKLPSDKLSMAVKAQLFEYKQSLSPTNPYISGASQAWIAIDKRMKQPTTK